MGLKEVLPLGRTLISFSFFEIYILVALVILDTVLLLGRDPMTTATLIEESISLGVAYNFRGLVHDHHCRKHGRQSFQQVHSLVTKHSNI